MRNPVNPLVVWAAVLLAACLSGAASAQTPAASGPGMGAPAVMFDAPDPPGFWVLGSVWYGSAGYIDITFDAPAGAAGGTYTVILTVTNHAGQDLSEGLDLWLTGPAAFSATPFPVSLSPQNNLPTVLEPDHLRFEAITWDDGDGNIVNMNLSISGEGTVQIRMAPIPEPGTAGCVLCGWVLLARRRGR